MVTLSNGGVISIAAGDSSGTVSVAAPSDDVYSSMSVRSRRRLRPLPVAILKAWRSTRLLPPPAITDTLDTTTLSLTAPQSVAEGGSIVYTASLTSPAGTAMSVNFGQRLQRIAIAAGSSTGSVSVAAPTDDV